MPAAHPRAGLVPCDEHLATLLIFADEELAAALRAARLAPLQRLGHRLRQADDLSGDQLRDPDRRVELEIALRPPDAATPRVLTYAARRTATTARHQARRPTVEPCPIL